MNIIKKKKIWHQLLVVDGHQNDLETLLLQNIFIMENLGLLYVFNYN